MELPDPDTGFTPGGNPNASPIWRRKHLQQLHGPCPTAWPFDHSCQAYAGHLGRCVCTCGNDHTVATSSPIGRRLVDGAPGHTERT